MGLFLYFAELPFSHLDRVHEVEYLFDILLFSPEVQLRLNVFGVVDDV